MTFLPILGDIFAEFNMNGDKSLETSLQMPTPSHPT